MSKLNHIEHSNLARRLIDTVGGLESAARICEISRTLLSNYQNPYKSETMPGRVISALQIAGGTTLYSDAMGNEVDQPETVIADPMHHTCGLVKETADALSAVEKAVSDGAVSPGEFSECDRELAEIEERVRIIRSGLRGKMRAP
ncbi:hypothetical protein [Brevundimonas sp. LjRoot202]|uniref:hypothetical protein n=1 Tax=Brevundimonas sp. LjRoot202 TaxID=3342281 RepID=UPI003ECF4DA6